MLYLILGWLALGLVTSVIGDVFLGLVFGESRDRQAFRSDLFGGDRLLLSLWLGIGSLSLVLLALSLMMPLKPIVGLLVGLVGLAIGAWRGSFGAIGGWQPRQILGWMVAIVGAAAWCNRPVTWHDTGYYHYSLVQWLGQYGTVPGLALLFNNLGFTSAWFALTAPFNPDSLAGRPLSLANGFAFLLLLGQGAAGIRGLMAGRRWVADAFSVCWVLLMLPLVLFLDPLSKILRSASPDLPVTLLVGVIAWVILWLNDRQRDSEKALSISAAARSLPLGLSLLAVTFKLIALPLLPITFLFAVWRQSWKAWVPAIALVILLLSPMVVGNLLTSGCPLYPGHILCVALPWSPAPASLESAALITHGWTHWYGTPPPGTHPWLWSLGQWFMSSPKEKITAFGILLGLAIALALALKFLKKSGLRGLAERLDRQGEPWLCGMGMFGLAFVMANSPFFRFSAPYIVLLMAMGLARVLPRILPRYYGYYGYYGSSYLSSETPAKLSKPAIGLSLVLVALCLGLESRSLLIPPPMNFSALWLQKETNGIVYRSPQSGDLPEDEVPDKDMCWTAEIPCAYNISPDIHLRDPELGIAGGFVRH
jgi:hypothetical protein